MTIYKRLPIFIFLFLAIICISLSSIGFAQAKKTVLIKDMAGREVRVPAQVHKAVGIEAGALRILVYLEATEMVAGVEDTGQKQLTKPYLMAHHELAKLPGVG